MHLTLVVFTFPYSLVDTRFGHFLFSRKQRIKGGFVEVGQKSNAGRRVDTLGGNVNGVRGVENGAQIGLPAVLLDETGHETAHVRRGHTGARHGLQAAAGFERNDVHANAGVIDLAVAVGKDGDGKSVLFAHGRNTDAFLVECRVADIDEDEDGRSTDASELNNHKQKTTTNKNFTL